MTRPLALDLHCHLERDEDVQVLADLVADDLDVLAITNHANKTGILLEQNRRIRALATLRPDLMLVFGMEWNVYGTHVNILFPSAAVDGTWLAGFLQACEPCADPSLLGPAIRMLADHPGDVKPIMVFNHPAFPDPALSARLVRDAIALRPPITLGVDGFHGHRGWDQAHADPFDYPGSAVNGLCDLLYQNGIRAPLLAGGDFHPNKQAVKPDVPPGVYQRVLLECPGKGYRPVFDALRRGAAIIVQDGIIRSLAVRRLMPGNGTWTLAVEIAVAKTLSVLEVIAGTGAGASVAATRRDIGPGTHRLEFDIPGPGIRYLRIRGKACTGRDGSDRAAGTAGFATGGIFPG